MNKQFLKGIVCLCMCLVLLTPLTVAAATPTESYTHQESASGNRQTVYSRDVYEAIRQIDGDSLGIDSLAGITDIYCATDGMIYLLCGEASRLFVLNSKYEFVKEISIQSADGTPCNYKGAQGIYVNKENKIFLADTLNSRIVITNEDGVIINETGTPQSDIIPEGFFYQPMKVLEDNEGYIYVLSQGCYYGILLYSAEFEFLGFYGANEVKTTVLDTLAYLWELLTSNDEKKAQTVKVLPYTMVDLTIDSEGYIYTCTGASDNLGSGQLRKISPGGSNILYRRELNGTASSASDYNFLETKVVRRLGVVRKQNVVALEVGQNGYMYALDDTYGKIYMYDQNCNLISVFGGGVKAGNQLGTFQSAVSVTTVGTDLLVADAATSSLTLFELTDFGQTLYSAQELYFQSRYSEAKPYWEKIIKQDGNSRLGYQGLAKAYYSEGDAENAVKYAKLGLDYVVYEQVHQERISQFIGKHFVLIFLAAVLLITTVVVALIKIRKRKTPLIKNEKIHCFSSVMFHPFQSFHDMKHRGFGSMRIAIGMTVLFIFSVAMKNTWCGFLFNKSDAESYNFLFTVAQTAGLLILGSVANWLVCSVMEGKGRLKDIYIVSSYAVLPIVIFNLMYTVLSHVVTIENVEILTSLGSVAYIYAFFILSVGMMAMHEIDFPKFLFTLFVTILFMILIVFIGFMIVILIQQFGNFLYSLYMEVVYR